MGRLLRDHGLTVALLGLCLFSIVGQSLAGEVNDNEERKDHGLPPTKQAAGD